MGQEDQKKPVPPLFRETYEREDFIRKHENSPDCGLYPVKTLKDSAM
jgi:hypothetical protein